MMESAVIKKMGCSSAVLSIFILCISSGIFVFDAQGQNIRVIGPTEDSQDYAPDSILVRFKSNTPENAKASARANVMGQLNKKYHIVEGLEHIKLNGISVEKAINILNKLPFVEYAEPDYVLMAIETPNDPGYTNGYMWGMDNIKADLAWDIETGADNPPIVAIIDSGIDYIHKDLSVNMWINESEYMGESGKDDDDNGYIDDINGWNFVSDNNNPIDDNGHGTHTAGTVAAVGNNSIGVVGVVWKAQLMALKFLDASGSGYTSGAVSALQYAKENGAIISNNSWGGGSYSQALYDAIDNSSDGLDHLFVAAAGNSGRDTDRRPFTHYPSCYDLDNIISVAAIDSNDNLARFSNYGSSTVDLAAPGVYIISTYPEDRYAYMDGTSMAAPHVSGVAALILAENPSLSWSDVKSRILNNTRYLASLDGKTLTGGTLNAYDALNNKPTSGENNPPTADFTYTTTDLIANFTDKSTDNDGSVVGWSWDFGDESGTSEEQNPIYTYAAAGTYTVTLTVTDDDGATGETSQNVIVSDQSTGDLTVDITSDFQKAGRNWKAIVYVNVYILGSNPKIPVSGAFVDGKWSYDISGNDVFGTTSGTTDSNGNVTFVSDPIKTTNTVYFTIKTINDDTSFSGETEEIKYP
ncbi:MAG: S8 family serine peptidase [Candidatus Omnitrophica bacterium]|nr:S8 family serine peptidase [Candidatus Omnitrophota bacterium]